MTYKTAARSTTARYGAADVVSGHKHTEITSATLECHVKNKIHSYLRPAFIIGAPLQGVAGNESNNNNATNPEKASLTLKF